MKDLQIENIVRTIYSDASKKDRIVELLSNICIDKETIIYRQDILKDNVSWQEAGKYLLGFKPVEKGLNNALSIYYKEPLKFADDYYKEELEPLAKQINSLQEFSFDDPMEAKRKRDELINRYSALYRKGLTVLQETFRSGPAVKHLANKSFKGFLQENALDANMRKTYIMNPTIVNYLKDYSGVE